VADGVDLRAASAARSFSSYAADRSGGPRVGLLHLLRQSSARSMRREPQMRKEPRIAPRGGRGGQQRRFARGRRCGRRRSGSRPTRGWGWRRYRPFRHVDLRRIRRAMRRRYDQSRGSPLEAAVVGSSGNLRAASGASAASAAGVAAGERAVGACGAPGGRAARRSAALRTLREPEMSIAAGRLPGGSPDGRRRLSSRASAARVSGAVAGRHADEAGGELRGRSSAHCGSTDAPRAGDMISRRDRPRRRS
jgi:hypothetical protein